MAKTHAVGIDLGTTYSAVAYLDDRGRTTMARNAEGEILTPSVVLFDRTEIVVGRAAKKAVGVRIGSVAEFAKRDMGNPSYSRLINGERLPPEVIQACILKKLRTDAEGTLGGTLKAVITVPAYFDEPRRKATADAGEMAGLDVLDIVNEPTAAALAFGETLGFLTPGGAPQKPMKILVYDLGGGTFDVTVIDLRPGDFRTLATDGDVHLGGHDWDQRLVDHVAQEYQQQTGVDPHADLECMARLSQSVEDAKHTLSARSRATVTVLHGGRSVDLQVTREKFEELTADLLERTAHTTRQVLAAAGATWKEIDRVLLVGGSTRMPMVSDMLRKLSSLEPDHSVYPDEAVARGAALYAGYLRAKRDMSGPPPGFSVKNVNAHSLGLEGIEMATKRKQNTIVIRRNTPLPSKITKKFTTKEPNQRSIVVQVLEGESAAPEQCSRIGRAVLRDLPPGLPTAWPVEVTYEYGENGRLDIRARLPGVEKELHLELQREGNLTAAQLGKWKQLVNKPAPRFDEFESLLDNVLGLDDPLPEPAAKAQPVKAQPAKPTGDTKTAKPVAKAIPASGNKNPRPLGEGGRRPGEGPRG